MVYIGTDPLVHRPATTGGAGERMVSVPGLVAAATWAVGLVIGLVAMAAGHEFSQEYRLCWQSCRPGSVWPGWLRASEPRCIVNVHVRTKRWATRAGGRFCN